MPMMKMMLWFLGSYKTESILLPLKGILKQTFPQTKIAASTMSIVMASSRTSPHRIHIFYTTTRGFDRLEIPLQMLKLRWFNNSGLDGVRLMLDHFQQNLVMQVQKEYLLNNFEILEPKGI